MEDRQLDRPCTDEQEVDPTPSLTLQKINARFLALTPISSDVKVFSSKP